MENEKSESFLTSDIDPSGKIFYTVHTEKGATITYSIESALRQLYK